MAQVRSQATTMNTVLPESGPTPTLNPWFLSMSMRALKPECDCANVVNRPRTKDPTPAPRSAARTGPFGFAISIASTVVRNRSSVTIGVLVMVVISSSPSSRDRGNFVDERAEDPGHAGGREGDDEERDQDLAHS